eukprot:CAMPEP_0206386506 /NCGR_PEP_ID=MMETSP0294-20121207/15988_1 /ASSEMBLY_ACC=CAM_ASM_000327 /TAXON_ID=39354 /ORGANISM="Heterosigma akashiwo, Strain CCMP2393" /LENGTH=184 /DNA_ID=CAMNT_0053837575 /DNA_START=192 /DNA_END=742 /DNA_ORIENTATION=-
MYAQKQVKSNKTFCDRFLDHSGCLTNFASLPTADHQLYFVRFLFSYSVALDGGLEGLQQQPLALAQDLAGRGGARAPAAAARAVQPVQPDERAQLLVLRRALLLEQLVQVLVDGVDVGGGGPRAGRPLELRVEAHALELPGQRQQRRQRPLQHVAAHGRAGHDQQVHLALGPHARRGHLHREPR